MNRIKVTMVWLSTNQKVCTAGIAFSLISTPVVYLGIIKVCLRNQFDNEAGMVMFMLYNAPFWFVLMFIAGEELYRRAVTRQFTRVTPIYMIMAGSTFIAVIGIIISPVGPGLFTRSALLFIAANLALGTISGFIVDRLFRKACNIGQSGKKESR